MHRLRRLHFEAYTMVSAELRRRVETSEQGGGGGGMPLVSCLLRRLQKGWKLYRKGSCL